MQEPRRVCPKCGVTYEPEVIFCPKDGAPLGGRKTEISDDPYLGLTIAGQLTIQQIIGNGAMGRVYRAHQSGIERDVAVKILHRELLRNSTVISRFHREAKVASRLVHPNVVQVLMSGDVDHIGPDLGGEAYLVMEYLDGISLRSALAAAGGALALPRALHIVLQVCDAVGEAHAQGVVHRDIKPENVMLVRRGDDNDFVKVLDFGVARVECADSSVATQAGHIFGTARYISPEGAQGAPVGPPGDVYSLAVLLFQCLSGQTPFDAESPIAILVKHTNEPPPDLRSLPRSSYVPEPIAAVVRQNLAKNPAERCQNAREFGRAIARAAREGGLHPDELVLRSTLLGDPTAAIQMASIERTRSLDLSAEAKERMAAGSRTAAIPDALSAVPSSGSTAAGASPITEIVEPTLTDEAAPDALRTSVVVAAASGTIGRESSPAIPSAREALPTGPRRRPGALRRVALIAAFFALGGALSAGLAHRLGAFDPPPPDALHFAERAREALRAGAFDAPQGDNVREITDSALRTWPGSEPILRVRRDAASKLLERARSERERDRAAGVRDAELALELDSGNEAARALLAELREQAVAVPVSIPEGNGAVTAASTRSSPPKRASKAPIPRAAPNTAEPPLKQAPQSGEPEQPARAAPDKPVEGGRWL